MTTRLRLVTSGVVLGGVLFGVAAFGIVRPSQLSPSLGNVSLSGSTLMGASSLAADPAGGAGAASLGASSATLADAIESLQVHLDAVPADHVSWATLGLAYVQQARITIDPSYYPKAEGALERSLEIAGDENFLALAGLSALAAGRHDFDDAADYARRGLTINPYSPLLHGALSDAQIQLGDYDAGFRSVQRMVDLSPDTSSPARASYAWELRGDVVQATALMQRALDDAPTAADRAFALFQLGELAFHDGRPDDALLRYREALAAAPDSAAALAGKARAEAALGQVQTALDDYAAVVARAPDPAHLIEYGDLLASLGRADDAAAQYRIVDATRRLFEANGVQPDPLFALFEADHGRVAAALDATEAGLTDNPFLTMLDARAWALHRAGRSDEARVMIDRALSTGYRNARFHFHAGMIAWALGDRADAAHELSLALSINPYFHPLEAPEAAATLAAIAADAEVES